MTEPHDRLSNISTAWTLLRAAHTGSPEQATAARELLWLRYGGAVYRYLAAAVADPHAAEDLAQEFGLALVRGEFHRADPGRGRFRDYVKTVLFGMVSDYHRRRGKEPRPGGPAAPAAADPDERFRRDWRDELLARAWAALADAQPEYHAVLRFRADHPDQSSAELAAGLTPVVGRPQTADTVRQALRRARTVFAGLLLDEVANSLADPTRAALAEELADLGLLTYCEPALKARAADPDPPARGPDPGRPGPPEIP